MDSLSYADAKQRFERDYLIQLLKITNGQVTDAARLAGRNRTEFYRLLHRHHLSSRHVQGRKLIGHGRRGKRMYARPRWVPESAVSPQRRG